MPNPKRSLWLKPIDEHAVAVMALPVFGVFGSILSMAGAFVGLVVGMSFGIQFPEPYAYGGLAGYEGASLFGNMVGAAVTSLILIRVWLREPRLQRRTLLIYVIAWLTAVVVQHFVALETHAWYPACIVAPIIITGLAIPFLRSRQR